MFILTFGRSSPSPLRLPPLHLSSTFTSSLSIFPSRWHLVLELRRRLPQSGKKLSLNHFRVRMIAEVGILFAEPEGRPMSQRPHLQSQLAYLRGNVIIKSILPYRELNLVPVCRRRASSPRHAEEGRSTRSGNATDSEYQSEAASEWEGSVPDDGLSGPPTASDYSAYSPYGFPQYSYDSCSISVVVRRGV